MIYLREYNIFKSRFIPIVGYSEIQCSSSYNIILSNRIVFIIIQYIISIIQYHYNYNYIVRYVQYSIFTPVYFIVGMIFRFTTNSIYQYSVFQIVALVDLDIQYIYDCICNDVCTIYKYHISIQTIYRPLQNNLTGVYLFK